jgi:hypothetical protein
LPKRLQPSILAIDTHAIFADARHPIASRLSSSSTSSSISMVAGRSVPLSVSLSFVPSPGGRSAVRFGRQVLSARSNPTLTRVTDDEGSAKAGSRDPQAGFGVGVGPLHCGRAPRRSATGGRALVRFPRRTRPTGRDADYRTMVGEPSQWTAGRRRTGERSYPSPDRAGGRGRVGLPVLRATDGSRSGARAGPDLDAGLVRRVRGRGTRSGPLVDPGG